MPRKKLYLLEQGDHSGFDEEGNRHTYQEGDLIPLTNESAANLKGRISGPLTKEELKRIQSGTPPPPPPPPPVTEEEVEEENDPPPPPQQNEGELGNNEVDVLEETSFGSLVTEKWARAQGLTDRDFEGMEPSGKKGFTKDDAVHALAVKDALKEE